MIKNNSNPQMVLSTLWIFILFNIIFRDLHEFLNEGYMQELMTLKVSETEKLLYGFLLEIPVAMVLLSRILNDNANKWTNVIAGGAMLLGMLGSLYSADMDDTFFTIINAAALLAILRTAWKLKK